MSPGAVPCVGLPARVPGETLLPGRAVPGAVSQPRSRVPLSSEPRSKAAARSKANPKDAQKAPNLAVPLSLLPPPPAAPALGAPVLGLSAGVGRGGR